MVKQISRFLLRWFVERAPVFLESETGPAPWCRFSSVAAAVDGGRRREKEKQRCFTGAHDHVVQTRFSPFRRRLSKYERAAMSVNAEVTYDTVTDPRKCRCFAAW